MKLCVGALVVLAALCNPGRAYVVPNGALVHWSQGHENMDIAPNSRVIIVHPKEGRGPKGQLIYKNFQTPVGNHFSVYCNGLKKGNNFVLFTVIDGNTIRHTSESDDLSIEYTEGNTAKVGLLYQEAAPKVRCVISSIPNSDSGANTPTEAPPSCHCGRSNRAMRVVGGEKAGRREFPWQIGFFYGADQDLPGCGGTILSSKYILTAAHCVPAAWDGQYKYIVQYGRDPARSNPATQVGVKRVIRHPDYSDAPHYHNDIALIELDSAIPFSSDVMPACLPEARQSFVGHQATVSGYGYTQNGGPGAEHLKKLTSEVMADSYCKSFWYDNYTNGKKTCLKVIPGESSCQGDSGGPLVSETRGIFDVIGVVSFGAVCGDQNPSVYTKVQYYLPWINQYLGTASDELICPR